MTTFLLTVLLFGERIGKYWLVRTFFARPRPLLPAASPRTVSILQPILSGDPTLWNCLTTNLQRKTTFTTEFLWLVDENDPVAIEGCRRLIQQQPTANVRLLIYPPPPNGVNPKMFKLMAGLKEANSELIAVLDDDTMLPNHAWETCAPYLDQPKVGLAFGLPYYVNFNNLWSALVAAFVNSFSLLTYVPYTYIRVPLTINGMFYVMKRTTLDHIGGFAALVDQLCDDYAVAQHVRQQGYTLVQTPLRHAISTQVKDASHYLNLLTRWLLFPQVSVMRSAAFVDQTLFYLFAFTPVFVPLLLLLALLIDPSVNLVLFALLYLGLDTAILWDFNQRYLNQATSRRALPLLLLMQLLLPLHTVWALLAPRRINWRGHVMRVQQDGGFSFIQRRTDA
ncbi:MAG: glycosyltransferase [Caldilineaceae bacterium]